MELNAKNKKKSSMENLNVNFKRFQFEKRWIEFLFE